MSGIRDKTFAREGGAAAQAQPRFARKTASCACLTWLLALMRCPMDMDWEAVAVSTLPLATISVPCHQLLSANHFALTGLHRHPGMQEDNPEVRKLTEKARGRQQFVYEGRTVYEWEQNIEETHIFIQPPEGVTKHHLDIKIEPRHLRVGIKGNPPFLNEDIFGLAETDASFWMIEDGELHIQLQKAHKGETWAAALRGHGQLDMFSEQEINKKLMLERFQEEHPGFDFSGATFSGQAPSARTFMGGVHHDPRSVR